MSSKLSVEEVLANLEERAAWLREQEAMHAQQEAYHREQRALHAAELETVQENLEAFRAVASAAVGLARPVAAPEQPPAPPLETIEPPPPGRLQVSRMLRLVVQSPSLAEPFGASAVAAEANRRFAEHLPHPIGERTASDVLRRMLAEGELQLARKGRPSYEALYIRRRRR